MDVNNQIAIITGGMSGMGRSCANMLLANNARVVILDKVINDYNDRENSITIQCDVSSEKDVSHALQIALDKFGIPRICINCAGIAPAKRMIGKQGVMPLSDFQYVININLVGTFNIMRLVASTMMQLQLSDDLSERGVIINTASIAAFEGQIGQMAYSASKGGVVAMTLPAARELAQYAIRLNTIAPGLVATPMLLNMPQNIQDNLASMVTFPKRLGKPEEFANLVLHLINNEFINGEVIRFDGAMRMQAK